MSPDRKCPSCGNHYPDDASHFNPKFPDCFRCRSKGISVTYGQGGKEAKQMFHDQTIKEFQDKTIREAASNGIEAVPAWTKTNYAPSTSAGFKKLDKALAPKKAE